jgi:hypothetical protein
MNLYIYVKYDMYSEYEITTFCIKRLGGEREFNVLWKE